MAGKYYLPGIGGQVEMDNDNSKGSPSQASPLLNSYSPRLFGAPPQLTNLNDMRLLSSKDGSEPGPVGDFYLQRILKDAQVANFVIGRAIFTGGMNNFVNVLRMMYQYGKAINNYDILGGESGLGSLDGAVLTELEKQANDISNGREDRTEKDKVTAAEGEVTPEVKDTVNLFSGVLGAVTVPLLHSLSVQQPFYTFESDWFSYINDVKMMINTAVIMLGLQKAVVRLGDNYVKINVNMKSEGTTPSDSNPELGKDPWSNYRFITPIDNIGTVTGFDKQTGDTNQYVSFMIEPTGVNESYTNNVGESQIFSSVIKQGEGIGNEIAFITNASVTKVDDAVLGLADGAISAAQQLVSNLGGGIGKFTASIAGSMAKSFLGDHTIYPQIFQSHTSTQTVQIRMKFKATSGDAYSYLTELLVPMFHVLGMVLPRLSKNNASAYSFPPLVQCNIPGMWGTRLGMVTSVSFNKSGQEASIYGWPTSVDVDLTVTDLTHVLMTSPMNKVSTFMNNHTMFDYIAQCAGVDKYRVNASMRLITRLALAQSAISDFPANLGSAILNDMTTWANRMNGTYRI